MLDASFMFCHPLKSLLCLDCSHCNNQHALMAKVIPWFHQVLKEKNYNTDNSTDITSQCPEPVGCSWLHFCWLGEHYHISIHWLWIFLREQLFKIIIILNKVIIFSLEWTPLYQIINRFENDPLNGVLDLDSYSGH